jgi:hypothetical protein
MAAIRRLDRCSCALSIIRVGESQWATRLQLSSAQRLFHPARQWHKPLLCPLAAYLFEDGKRMWRPSGESYLPTFDAVDNSLRNIRETPTSDTAIQMAKEMKEAYGAEILKISKAAQK